LEYLGIELLTHMPKGKGGRRTTARAKGKVERPFRTIKELHETLYHFHTPKNEEEANVWLLNYVLRYNEKPHRSENHSRMEDWIKNVPASGLRKGCSWDRFATFAREPERRKVGSDATIKVGGGTYRVDSALAGQDVILWWGLFDTELFIEHGEEKLGPFRPGDGPIPLHKFRAMRKTKADKRADIIEKLAKEIALPKAALTVDSRTTLFIDEAHDLHGNTLIGLKRLIEMVQDCGGTLSVILAGHPKLKNDLRRSSLEEIGSRTTVFDLDGIAASKREFIEWLLQECTKPETDVHSIISDEAIDLLA
jgi:hypothetical protein